MRVEDLSVGFHTDDGPVRVLESVSYDVPRGTTVGLVGESGCGKSVSVMTLMGLLASPPSFVDSGRILFEGEDLLRASSSDLRAIRGDRIGMIFQEPMTSLNPTFTIGYQLGEALRIHRQVSSREVEERCLQMLELIGIGAPRERLRQYPHELSGGLRQRVMIAMALICNPDLLIADEPTTALDVTIQAQILELLRDLQRELNMSIIMITHDLGVVAEMCSHVHVMYAGRIIEQGPVRNIFENPLHPYTRGLIESIPKLDERREWLPTIKGIVPSPADRGTGCHFADRCAMCENECRKTAPSMRSEALNHYAACWALGGDRI